MKGTGTSVGQHLSSFDTGFTLPSEMRIAQRRFPISCIWACTDCGGVVGGHIRGSNQPHSLNQSAHLLQPVSFSPRPNIQRVLKTPNDPQEAATKTWTTREWPLKPNRPPSVLKPSEDGCCKSIAMSNLVFRFCQPDCVAQPQSVAHVQVIVREAKPRSLEITIKCNGH